MRKIRNYINFLFRLILGWFRLLKGRIIFGKIGKRVSILGRIVVLAPGNIEIGDDVVINEGVILNGTDTIKIGNFVHISSGAEIHTGGLDLNEDYRCRKHIKKSISIDDGAWICSSVVVTPGVNVGKGSVIAAGSVVTKNVPNFELWGGVPAKKIKDLPRF